MRIETKTDGNGNEFEVPVDYHENIKGKFHKVRKKSTNFTPKKKKRK
jgi:hypothetical protein